MVVDSDLIVDAGGASGGGRQLVCARTHSAAPLRRPGDAQARDAQGVRRAADAADGNQRIQAFTDAAWTAITRDPAYVRLRPGVRSLVPGDGFAGPQPGDGVPTLWLRDRRACRRGRRHAGRLCFEGSA